MSWWEDAAADTSTSDDNPFGAADQVDLENPFETAEAKKEPNPFRRQSVLEDVDALDPFADLVAAASQVWEAGKGEDGGGERELGVRLGQK
jgi:hypothetical protein